MDEYVKQSFLLVIILSGIPLVSSSIVGLLVSIIQSSTQIQEQSVSYLAKFITLSVVLAISSSFFFSQLIQFMQNTLASISILGGLP